MSKHMRERDYIDAANIRSLDIAYHVVRRIITDKESIERQEVILKKLDAWRIDIRTRRGITI